MNKFMMLVLATLLCGCTTTDPQARIHLNVQTSEADIGGFDIDSSYGFGLAGEFKPTPGYSIAGHIDYQTGEIESLIDADLLSFSIVNRFYPMGWWEEERQMLQPFVLIGGGYTRVDLEFAGISVDETDFMIRYGGGLDFFPERSKTLLIRAEIYGVEYYDDLEEVDQVVGSFGFGVRF